MSQVEATQEDGREPAAQEMQEPLTAQEITEPSAALEGEEQAVAQEAKAEPKRRRAWWQVFLIGVVLYAAALGALILSRNPNLFPTVVMIGNFLVPITYVAFLYESQHVSQVRMPTAAMSFVYGGVLGVIAASLLEPLFIRRLDFATAFVVGLIEEFVKILGVLVVARHRRHDAELDGLILGAAAGMGFAALESTGYAFTAFLSSQGSLSAVVGVTLLRGILSPLGHGTWTAILAAVLFRESKAGRFRISLKVIGAYLMVVILHGLWDGLPGVLTNIVSSGLDILIAQLAIGAVGLFILWRHWREGERLALERQELAAVSESTS
jgi:RsiW-degrading membrane proteinase PrsW (M82 family)